MMIHMAWVILSFFAVIGVLECLLGVLELLSLRRVKSVKRAVFRVELSGDEQNVEYLLNTLCVKAERLNIGNIETVLEVVDVGLSPEGYRAVEQYCEKNPWVLFTDHLKDDII